MGWCWGGFGGGFGADFGVFGGFFWRQFGSLILGYLGYFLGGEGGGFWGNLGQFGLFCPLFQGRFWRAAFGAFRGFLGLIS